MVYQMNIKTMLLTLTIVMSVFLNAPTQASASGSLVIGSHHHEHVYTEVMVSGNRYYYDQGVFYTGSPDHYVVVEAPEGAIIYDAPVHYETVIIGGTNYYRYHDVYYRHGDRGYEVVRVPEHRDHEDRHDNRRDNHHDNHHDNRR